MKKEGQIIKFENGEFYQVKLCGQTIRLPLFQAVPNLKIAIFNILGETVLVKKVARSLAKKIPANIEVIVTPEAKSICLAYELSSILKIPYVVVRKTLKPYMLNSLKAEVLSITTGKPQTLYLDGKDRELLKGKSVVLIDDVISTGGTLRGLRKLMEKAGVKEIVVSAVFTEGNSKKWSTVVSLGHLPIFKT